MPNKLCGKLYFHSLCNNNFSFVPCLSCLCISKMIYIFPKASLINNVKKVVGNAIMKKSPPIQWYWYVTLQKNKKGKLPKYLYNFYMIYLGVINLSTYLSHEFLLFFLILLFYIYIENLKSYKWSIWHLDI